MSIAHRSKYALLLLVWFSCFCGGVGGDAFVGPLFAEAVPAAFDYDGHYWRTVPYDDATLLPTSLYDNGLVCTERGRKSIAVPNRTRFVGLHEFLAAERGLAGVTEGEASALARQIYGIKVTGQPAVSSVEAFGSRAGSTFRGRGPLPTSDLDIRITLTDPAHFGVVNAEMSEIANLFQSAKGFPLEPTYVIPGLPPPVLLRTPFIPLKQ